jgi:hypothetical protein
VSVWIRCYDPAAEVHASPADTIPCPTADSFTLLFHLRLAIYYRKYIREEEEASVCLDKVL